MKAEYEQRWHELAQDVLLEMGSWRQEHPRATLQEIEDEVDQRMIVLTQIAGDESLAKLLLLPSVPGSDELLVLAATIAGSCLGFLWWNCLPAQVFMARSQPLA